MGIIKDIFQYGTPIGWMTLPGEAVAEKLGEVIGPTVLNATDQGADLEAINGFFLSTTPSTVAAEKLKDDWMRWYSALSMYDKATNENIAAEAFNRRNAFIRAQATPDEKVFVDQWIKDVPAYDPVTGKPNYVTSTGDRIKQPEPLIPTSYKIAAFAAAGVTLVLVALKKLRLL